MTALGWLQILAYAAVILALTKPAGAYMYRVFEGARQPLPQLFGPVERFIYRVCGIDAEAGQTWSEYARAFLVFSLLGLLVTYLIERLQGVLPLNPQSLPDVEPALAFNTAVSFTTNTNWQSYSGESTMSYLTQMAGLAWHNFTSAGAGIGVALALARGLTRRTGPDGGRTVGSFWVDLVRSIVYVLLPVSLLCALVLVSQGVVQGLAPHREITTLEGSRQVLALGPVASQEAIKELGTNGGGFFNANSAHPFENPSPLTNLFEMVLILVIPAGLTYTYGCMAGNMRQGWALFAAMGVLFLAGAGATYWAESHPNTAVAGAVDAGQRSALIQAIDARTGPSDTHPQRAQERGGTSVKSRIGIGVVDDSGQDQSAQRSTSHAPDLLVDQGQGNMEGKEIRFGVAASALFATVTTDASCGAVNAMHDSFTPLGGLVPLVNIQLGEVIFGGVGAGLYGILVFVILAVFIAGLMVGRTPEYLGKKIEAREMKLAMLYVLVFPLLILALSAWAAVVPYGVSSLNNAGPHGLSEILYAFTSGAGNNGSAFAGLNANTPWWNVVLGLVMLAGRFLMIVPALAIAGSMVGKKVVPPGLGTFPTDGPLFTALLVSVILILGALTFFPALCLGPILEHTLAAAGKVF